MLTLANERFCVPEVLFQPSLVGLECAGLPDAIAQAIGACPPYMAPALWGNIVLTGGNANLPGLEARLAADLPSRAPAGMPIRLYTPPAPELAAWRGASAWSQAGPAFTSTCLTKAAYAEGGAAALARLCGTPPW